MREQFRLVDWADVPKTMFAYTNSLLLSGFFSRPHIRARVVFLYLVSLGVTKHQDRVGGGLLGLVSELFEDCSRRLVPRKAITRILEGKEHRSVTLMLAAALVQRGLPYRTLPPRRRSNSPAQCKRPYVASLSLIQLEVLSQGTPVALS